MPAGATSSDRPPQEFLLRQPFWEAVPNEPDDPQAMDALWELACHDDEPSDEDSTLESAHRSPSEKLGEGLRGRARWQRIPREQLLELATRTAPEWQFVGVVCGAGLGKTTNLQWLQAALSRMAGFLHPSLPWLAELHDLSQRLAEAKGATISDCLVARIAREIANTAGIQQQSGDGRQSKKTFEQVEVAVRRLLKAGRVTLLLDSLDQADAARDGDVVRTLQELHRGIAADCRVWVSGRPYAFASAKEGLRHLSPHWRFIRIGQLDEPECRQLLERSGRR